MVTVSIFTLRDVIRQVQNSYKIPYNSTTHTSPATDGDIQEICDYIQKESLQTYTLDHKENKWTTPAHDLVGASAAYANTASAFNNFQRDTHNALNHGTAHGDNTSTDSTDDGADMDLGADVDFDMDDLTVDEEEFPVGTDIVEFVAMAHEAIDELSQYE
jgi:hypothetical protein